MTMIVKSRETVRGEDSLAAFIYSSLHTSALSSYSRDSAARRNRGGGAFLRSAIARCLAGGSGPFVTIEGTCTERRGYNTGARYLEYIFNAFISGRAGTPEIAGRYLAVFQVLISSRSRSLTAARSPTATHRRADGVGGAVCCCCTLCRPEASQYPARSRGPLPPPPTQTPRWRRPCPPPPTAVGGTA